MTARQWFGKLPEIAVALIVSLASVPVLFVFTCIAFIGATLYIPFHFWTTIRQSIQAIPSQSEQIDV